MNIFSFVKNTKVLILIVILISLVSVLPFFSSKFFYTQDYIFVARLQQMHEALLDGQFPVRWSPDLRFGEPAFNFYAPLPYYIGAIIKIVGLDYLTSLKVLFILSSVLSAVVMFLLLKKLFDPLSGLIGAVLYVFAPYRAVDLYVRGALSEAWAFVFFPLIFLTAFNLSEKNSLKNIAFLSLTLGGLFLTHNVTTIMFLPFFTFWVIYLIWKQKNIRLVLPFAVSLLLGIALSASFLLPAFFERGFIQTQHLTTGHFDFRAHFVTFGQFFSLFWGYGSSLWGPVDELSFQVGLVNWLVFALLPFVIYINRKKSGIQYLYIFLVIVFLFSLFLQHNKSAFLWEVIPLMSFIQFPWRFLSISVFIISILGGLLVYSLNNKFRYLSVVFVVASIILNFSYFQPGRLVEDSFFGKFLEKSSMQEGVDLTKDYLPIWVKNTTNEPVLTPYVDNGDAKISDYKRQSSSANFKVEVLADAKVIVPITYFPGWEVKINGKKVPQNEPTNLGLINFNLPVGEYVAKINFENTPVRNAGNIISLLTLFVIALLLINGKFYGKKD